jgi:hypothetical protein
MPRWHPNISLRLACLLAPLSIAVAAQASEYHGQVTFNGLPVPGATVIATQGGKKLIATSDQQGLYSFPDLPDGAWSIEVDMLCFSQLKQEVTVGPNAAAAKWELKLLPFDQIMAQASAVKPEPTLTARAAPPVKTAATRPDTPNIPEPPKPPDDSSPRPSDGLLINGTSSNAATSAFSMAAAFGNSRSSKSLYNGSLGLILDNSTFDAKPYSLTGIDTAKPYYNRATGVFTFGGPIHIPHLMPRGPNFFLAYQWTRDRDDSTLSGLVPGAAERTGDFSSAVNSLGQPLVIVNPATGLPFPGAVGPISPQAQALLNLYPLPNLAGDTLYNYQVAEASTTHQDALQSRLSKSLGRKDQVYGGFAFQSERSSSASLFGFADTTDALGVNTNANWSHRLTPRLYETLGYQFSRLRTHVLPEFANRQNISGEAGITGNLQDPPDWGPPTLAFSSGIASLSDAQSALNRNETNAVSESVTWSHGRHNLTFGGDFRRQEFNVFSQQNPRGAFSFTGAATQQTVNGATTGGSDFADFLLGIPDTSAIAFGHPDKYLRQSVYDAFLTDDWRLRPELTINAGLRWEYGAPITELKNRLVNLDIAPDSASAFSAIQPVLASNPNGPLTGQHYPASLLRPDHLGIEPRVGISWRPIPGSTLVVRAGYGVYDDTSMYQATALDMAQQEPLSTSLSVENSICPITLASGFNPCASITADNFAVDPNFRVGYAQTWQISAQRDLPGALVGTVTYLGIKGTRGVQEYLPNTYPLGGANPCPSCPAGFVYRASNGDSARESGQVQLRRRLRSGFTATLQYTYSKSIDDDSVLGGQGPVAAGAASQTTASASIAQNWLDLRAERGLSTFDQRNLLNATLQYTSGMGKGGGTLLSGWRGTMLKEWTVQTQIVAGAGLPETPIYLAATPGTGVTGSIRPNVTGASIHKAAAGLFLNPAAYTAPTAGQWGNAARDSITGPGQFTLNASLARTFRLKDHFNLDARIDSTNLLNHVVFSSWNTIVNGTTFGEPASANAMRSLQTTLRLRY